MNSPLPWLSLMVILASSMGSAVRAQDVATASDPELDEARKRFDRGVQLYSWAQFDEALAEFNKAYELAPNYRVLFNLAQVQVERHDTVAALRLFRKYLEQGGSQIPPDRRRQVERALVSLQARIAELWVRSSVDGAQLLIDGTVIGQLPLAAAVPVSAGVHHIQLRKAGYETVTRTITVAGNDTRRLELFMHAETPQRRSNVRAPATKRPVSAPQPLPLATPVSVTTRDTTLFWLSLVSTGLLAGGAVTFGLLTRAANARFEAELSHFPPDPHRIESARASLRCDALLTDGFSAATLAFGGATLYFAVAAASANTAGRDVSTTRLRLSQTGLGMEVFGAF